VEAPADAAESSEEGNQGIGRDAVGYAGSTGTGSGVLCLGKTMPALLRDARACYEGAKHYNIPSI